jgi:macrolide-specific efflux system membrane fusion protein
LHVGLGQHVKKGDLLATIDPTIAQNELQANEAGLETASAELELRRLDLQAQRRELERQEVMLRAEATPRADFEKAQDDVRRIELQIRQLEAKLQQSRLAAERSRADLAYTQLRAPMDGEVIAIAVQEGQTLNAAQQAPTVMTLAQLDRMTAKAQIPEADIGRVHVGQKIYFTTLGDMTERYFGVVRAIQPTGEKVHDALFFDALFDVPNPQGRLWPDLTVQVSAVIEERKHVLVVPIAALGEKGKDGRNVVRVLGVDDKVTSRSVRAGIDDRVRAQVLEGLSVGEKVLVPDVAPAAPSPETGEF